MNQNGDEEIDFPVEFGPPRKIKPDAAKWIRNYMSGHFKRNDRMLYRIPLSVDAFFKKEGFNKLLGESDIDIYRGLSFKSVNLFRQWWNDSIVDPHKERYTVVLMKENKISSWTTFENVAGEFASGKTLGDGTFDQVSVDKNQCGIVLRYLGNINDQIYGDLRYINRSEGEILLKTGILECYVKTIYVGGKWISGTVPDLVPERKEVKNVKVK